MGQFFSTVMPHLHEVYHSVRRHRSAEGNSGLPKVSQAADHAAQFMIRLAAWTPSTTGIRAGTIRASWRGQWPRHTVANAILALPFAVLSSVRTREPGRLEIVTSHGSGIPSWWSFPHSVTAVVPDFLPPIRNG